MISRTFAITLDMSEQYVCMIALDTYIQYVQGNKDWSPAEKAAAIATAEGIKRKIG